VEALRRFEPRRGGVERETHGGGGNGAGGSAEGGSLAEAIGEGRASRGRRLDAAGTPSRGASSPMETVDAVRFQWQRWFRLWSRPRLRWNARTTATASAASAKASSAVVRYAGVVCTGARGSYGLGSCARITLLRWGWPGGGRGYAAFGGGDAAAAVVTKTSSRGTVRLSVRSHSVSLALVRSFAGVEGRGGADLTKVEA